ncbi:LBF_2804 family protein [Spirosoma sp.]|uniref:LBF_2804 family protein n=1 Tax=Spirosoma sp. TaxID=1899569 RepID=UPI003B3A4BBA
MGPFDHLALRYLRQALDSAHPADEPYVLNPVESRVIRRTKIITLTVAAFLGIAGVLLLYWPQYIWPDLFVRTAVPLFGTVYDLPLITTLYGILLVYIEVNLLIALNLRGVKTIMQVCQFPSAHDAQYDRHLQALANATLEKNTQGILRFGIDPYLNNPRWGLNLFFLLNIVKAALSNFLLKFVLKRFIGRYALRQLTDLAGMPIYALWNAWASWQVLHEAQVRVMAPTTIREFVHELHDEWGKNDEFRPLILEALQYVAILKRQYNYAHFLLTETLMDRFKLRIDAPLTGDFPERVLAAPQSVRRSLERLIIFGVLVDGKLSWLEKRRLRELRSKGFLTYSITDIQRLGSDYNQGRGLWV